MAQKITIACAGCGRTQTLRPSKVRVCDYYTCSGSCKANPAWEHPYQPEGFVRVWHMNAAGAFSGHELRPATEEELKAIARAQAIKDAALQQISEAS